MILAFTLISQHRASPYIFSRSTSFPIHMHNPWLCCSCFSGYAAHLSPVDRSSCSRDVNQAPTCTIPTNNEHCSSPQEDTLFLAAVRVVLIQGARRTPLLVTSDEEWWQRPNRRAYPLLARQLQIVSLSLCRDCRTTSAFRVRVGVGIPRRMMGASMRRDGSSSQRLLRSGRDGSPRIPSVRVSSVIWERSAEGLGDRYEVMCLNLNTARTYVFCAAMTSDPQKLLGREQFRRDQ